MRNILFALSFPFLVFLSACNSCPSETSTITLGTDAGVFLRNEAKGRIDETFEKTLAATYATVEDPYDISAFVEGFFDRFAMEDFPDGSPLRRYFPAYEGEKMDVVNEIKRNLEDVHEGNMVIIRQRLESWLTACSEMRNTAGSLKFELKVPTKGLEQAQRLASSSANIQFRETFLMQEVYGNLMLADSFYKTLVLGDTMQNEGGEGELELEEEEEIVEGGFEEMINDVKGAGASTANKALMMQEFKAGHPLMGMFNLEAAMSPEGPIIGYADVEDTARIGEVLRHPLVHPAFPPGFRFYWSMKPERPNHQEIILPALYAIRMPRPGSPAGRMGGDDIVEAYAGEEGPEWAVSVNLNPKGSQLFEEMTRDNVNRPIAILIDGNVLSAPVVNTPIMGGRVMITGGFTEEEAGEMASLLTIGALGAPVNVVGVQ